jgi:gliding motility-associated-like protein
MGNGCTTSNIRYVWVAEGANGDLYLAGTIPNCPDPRYLVVFKLNSAGDILWKYNFTGHFTASYCMGIFYDGSYITVINRGDGSSQFGVSVDLVRLDASTGNYISHKSWEPDLPYPLNFPAGFLNWTPTVVRLNNGNYCLYGNTFGDFFNPLNDDLPHFSILEFNNNYDFVKGYTINSTLAPNAYESKIKVDRFGKVIYSLTVQLNYPDEIKYYGIADNGVILNQRKKAQNGLESFYDNTELFNNGSVVYINNLATVDQSNFYLYYTLMHVTDTGSECLGTIDNFSHTVPISYKPNSFAWTAPNPNPLIATSNQNNSVVPIIYTGSPPCYQKTFCDTLKIHGNATSCDLQQDFSFTAFKNIQCGARVNWLIDTSAIQSLQVVNDTSVLIKFDQPWQGWLYAKMMTSCGELKDSVLLTISVSPGPVNVGPDTTICTSNIIVVNAHKGYATYQWNNGSTDSLISITAPGIYYVDVTDVCGNSFSDTVVVLAAPPIPLSIGPDRIKCNSDTLHLQAPPGFMNYAWGPNYNISATNTQQVIINPAVDTVYTLMAEKTRGCFGYDTIRITVNNSPAIYLGPDKSFCAGDSLVLNAGPGFAQYQWSNGNSVQQITTFATGSYSVIGMTAEGCKSFDTLTVLNVYQLPIVVLNQDSTLCTGDQRTLDAGSGFANYIWNTGSSSRSIIVNNIGVYSVIVTDNNGCKGTDSTKITFMLPKPAAFLGQDTSICPHYDRLELKPMINFDQYKWSTGSSASAIMIKQPGIYWLQVKDDNGCVGKDSIIVNPKDCGKGFFVPTGFTPNNDGLNDLLKPILIGDVIQYRFWVYNRWGELIFETTDLTKGWNGTYKGADQSSGVFVWMCTYQFKDEQVKKEKGTFVLIR